MNSRNKRANSGANSPQQEQFTSVPRSLIKVGLVLPVGCNIADMEWALAPEPEQVEDLPEAVASFRRAVVEPLAELLHGTLIVDGSAR